jgi:hypothetical protein
MPYEKIGNLKLSKSKRAVLIFLDHEPQPFSVAVSGVKDLLDGKKSMIDLSRIVEDAVNK